MKLLESVLLKTTYNFLLIYFVYVCACALQPACGGQRTTCGSQSLGLNSVVMLVWQPLYLLRYLDDPFFFFFFFWDRVSLSSGWPQTYNEARNKHELMIYLPSLPSCCSYRLHAWIPTHLLIGWLLDRPFITIFLKTDITSFFFFFNLVTSH